MAGEEEEEREEEGKEMEKDMRWGRGKGGDENSGKEGSCGWLGEAGFWL